MGQRRQTQRLATRQNGKPLAELIGRLGRLDLDPVQHRALAEAAQSLDEALRDAFAVPEPGAQQTAAMRTELRNSITHRVGTSRAMIGSTSMVAMRQEVGGRCAPPRPLIARLGAERGKSIAEATSAAVVDAIRAALTGLPSS